MESSLGSEWSSSDLMTTHIPSSPSYASSLESKYFFIIGCLFASPAIKTSVDLEWRASELMKEHLPCCLLGSMIGTLRQKMSVRLASHEVILGFEVERL